MSKTSNSIRIPCSKLVKEYNVDNLRRIAGMGYGEVYHLLTSGEPVISKFSGVVRNLAQTLIDNIPFVIPTEPMSAAERVAMTELCSTWKAAIEKLQMQISSDSKPIYLADEVTHVLAEKGSDLKCERVMLEWYLSAHRDEPMEPENIADAILSVDGTDWEHTKHLVKDAAYHIRPVIPSPTDDSPVDVESGKRRYLRGRYDEILRVFEFIYSFSTLPDIEDVAARLRHDLEVIRKFLTWRKEDTADYSYAAKYIDCIDALQTLPDAARNMEFLRDLREKVQFAPRRKKFKGASRTSKAPRNLEHQPVALSSGRSSDASIDSMSVTESGHPVRPEDARTVIHHDNYGRLLDFLKQKVESGVKYLDLNMKEPHNISAMKLFSARPDFEGVFHTLSVSAVDDVTASMIMQFIRNVANHNICDWGAPAPGKRGYTTED